MQSEGGLTKSEGPEEETLGRQLGGGLGSAVRTAWEWQVRMPPPSLGWGRCVVGLTLLWGLGVLKSAWVLGRVLPVSSRALGPNLKWMQTGLAGVGHAHLCGGPGGSCGRNCNYR